MRPPLALLLLPFLLLSGRAAAADCAVPLAGSFRGHLPPPGAADAGVTGDKVYFELRFGDDGALDAGWVGDTTMVRGRGDWVCAGDALTLRVRLDDAPGDAPPLERNVTVSTPEPGQLALAGADGAVLALHALPDMDAGNPFGLTTDASALTIEGHEHVRCAAMFASISGPGEGVEDLAPHLAMVQAEVGDDTAIMLMMDEQMKAMTALSVGAVRRVGQGMTPREYFARLIEPCEGIAAP